MNKPKTFHSILLTVLFCVFIWSIFKPNNWPTWTLESFPVILCLIILITTYKKLQFTNFAYTLIWINLILALIGAHYTFPKVPIFNWLKEVLTLNRNHYDRLTHFLQGFSAAIIIREFFIRKNILNKKKWLNLIVICICLSISAFYELIEFSIAKIAGGSQSFLATQGDIWDTQWDMTCALIGSLTSTLLLKKYHNKILNQRGGL